MKYECFEVTIEDSIAHIELSRPQKRNSMNPAFWRELPQIIEDIDENVRARVIVISSTGPHFTAGMDLAAFSSKEESEERRSRREAAGDRARSGSREGRSRALEDER